MAANSCGFSHLREFVAMTFCCLSSASRNAVWCPLSPSVLRIIRPGKWLVPALPARSWRFRGGKSILSLAPTACFRCGTHRADAVGASISSWQKMERLGSLTLGLRQFIAGWRRNAQAQLLLTAWVVGNVQWRNTKLNERKVG